MLGRTIHDKLTALINKQINDVNKRINHKDIVVLGVKNGVPEANQKTITINTITDGKKDDPFDVVVDVMDTEGILEREVWLPAPTTRERVMEVLRHDYLWDLSERELQSFIKETIVETGTVVIDLNPTYKYLGELKIHFVESMADVPEEHVGTISKTLFRTSLTAGNNDTSNFIDGNKKWHFLFDNTKPMSERIEIFFDICMLSLRMSNEDLGLTFSPAQRVLWAEYDKLELTLGEAKEGQRELAMVASKTGAEDTHSVKMYSIAYPGDLSPYANWPTWLQAAELARTPVRHYFLHQHLEINKDGLLDFKAGTDLTTIKTEFDMDLMSDYADSGVDWNNIINHVPRPDMPFAQISLDDKSGLQLSWGLSLMTRQINWSVVNTTWLRGLEQCLSLSTYNNNAKTIRPLLNIFSNSPELIKVASWDYIKEIFGEKQYIRVASIEFCGVPELAGKSFEMEFSTTYSSDVVTVPESFVSSYGSEIKPGELSQLWLKNILAQNSTDTNEAGVFMFASNFLGDLGYPFQYYSKWNSYVEKATADWNYYLPYCATIIYSEFEGKNKVTLSIDKEAKTATYSIEGQPYKLVLTDAEVHAASV